VAGFTALIYDHLITLNVEIDLIWMSRPGLVSIIFLLNRYLVPLMLVVDLFEMFGLPSASPTVATFCKVWTAVQGYLTIASFMSIHVIVALRVYAMHNGRKWIGRTLWIACTIYFLSSTSIITVATAHLIPGLEPELHSCVGKIPSYLWLAWLPSVIFESILFALTVYAMMAGNRRRSFNTLTLILYRDGLLYFFAVTVCSLFSLFVWALADPTFIGLARYFALAAVNLVGSRMVLNLKSYAASMNGRARDWDDPDSTDGFGFAPQPQDTPQHPDPSLEPGSTDSGSSEFDLEMYYIERDFQQIGTRLH